MYANETDFINAMDQGTDFRLLGARRGIKHTQGRPKEHIGSEPFCATFTVPGMQPVMRSVQTASADLIINLASGYHEILHVSVTGL